MDKSDLDIKETRKYIRLNTVFPVEIRFIDRKTGKNISNIIQCFTRDISSGGMCIEIAFAEENIFPIAESENIKLSFTLKLPFSKRPISAFANIAWMKKVNDSAFTTLLLGITYENIIESDRIRLLQYARSLKRKPYIIAIIILLLLFYGIYISYNYNYAYEKTKNLLKNLNKTSQNEKEINEKLNILHEKEILLKNTLATKEQKIEELSLQIEQIASNLKDESKEKMIEDLKNKKKELILNIEKLNEEINYLKKYIDTLKAKKLYLYVSNNGNSVLLNKDVSIDIITLNNNTILLGNILKEQGLKITISLFDKTIIDLYVSDIKSINRLGISDSPVITISKPAVTVTTPIKTIVETEPESEKIHIKSPLEIELLNKIQYDSFLYFLNEVNKSNGLIRDANDSVSPCSIAVVGFALASYCIAESKGWMTYKEAYDLSLKTLQTFYNKLENEHGFFYHFISMSSGKRVWNSEISSIDTTLFICGALVAGEYFKNTEVSELAKKLYDRIDWKWMTNNKNVLCLGWKPETGFLPYFWDTYDESILSYILGSGSDTYPLDKESWKAWKRPIGRYIASDNKEYECVYCQTGSLFVYQFPHLWIDFKNINDNGINYWKNSIIATKANKQFCLDNSSQYKTYEKEFWGLSASMGPDGYKGYGAEPGIVLHDGTVSPYSVICALPYAPDIALPTIKKMYDEYKNNVYGFYGFKDAFNLDKNWFSKRYIGIDQGASILAIENYLSGFIWKYLMQTQAVKNWLKKCIV